MPTLAHLARLALHRDGFLALPLARYQLCQHLDDAALVQQLQCSPDQLVRLKLCSIPRPDQWHSDLEQIATYLHLDAAKLAAVLSNDTPEANAHTP